MANEQRLIDANDIWKKTFVCDEVAEVRKFIENAPAADAVEVVHGRWVFGTANHREYMKCSECLHSYTPDGTFCYCPNCGAKMDGDGNA